MVSHSKQGGKNMHNRFILFKNDDVGRQSSRGFKSRNVTVFYGVQEKIYWEQIEVI